MSAAKLRGIWALVGGLMLSLASAARADDHADHAEDTPRLAVKTSSQLAVIIRNDTSAMLSRMGHDHVIVAQKASGSVVWPAEPGGRCEARVEVPVRELVVDPEGWRERMGLDDNTIDENDKGKLSKNMWGSSQLDADNHPKVIFEVTSCPGGTGSVTVQGELTVRGVPAKVTVPLQVSHEGGVLRAKGRFSTTHAAHGFKPFRATPMGPRNDDKLEFYVELVAKE